MRLNAFISACLAAASLVHASPVGNEEPKSSWGGLVASITNRFAPAERVPGQSTIYHCKGTGPQDIGTLDFVDILPRVLSKNSAVAVNTSASLSKAIGEGEGVIVELSVKFSFIPIKIINRKDPMCELIKQIGLECPFNAGPVAFQKEVMVPDRFIPAGMYHIRVNAYTKQGEPLICLNIDQKFK